MGKNKYGFWNDKRILEENNSWRRIENFSSSGEPNPEMAYNQNASKRTNDPWRIVKEYYGVKQSFEEIKEEK